MARRDKIFISYRRSDSENVAKLITEQLQVALPNIDFFLDLKGIETATEWSNQIFTELINSNAVLALIGQKWVTAFQQRTASTDVMLREIEWAFDKKRPVLPILVNGASMPSLKEIPPTIAQLHRMQAFTVQKSTFADDVERLAERISRLVNEYGDAYGNWSLESGQTQTKRTPSFGTGKWESQVTHPNGNSIKLEFTIRDGTLDVLGHYTLASDGIRHPFSATHSFLLETSGVLSQINAIVLDGFIEALGPFHMTIPIRDKRGDVYVGESEEGLTFWTRLIEQTW